MVRVGRTIPQYEVPIEGFTQFLVTPPVSRMVMLSGLTSRQPDGTVGAVGDAGGQAELILQSMTLMLESVGASLDDVVRIVTYLTNIDDLPAVHEVRRKWFGDTPPASSTVQVVRLYKPEQMVEIEATAILSS